MHGLIVPKNLELSLKMIFSTIYTDAFLRTLTWNRTANSISIRYSQQLNIIKSKAFENIFNIFCIRLESAFFYISYIILDALRTQFKDVALDRTIMWVLKQKRDLFRKNRREPHTHYVRAQ